MSKPRLACERVNRFEIDHGFRFEKLQAKSCPKRTLWRMKDCHCCKVISINLPSGREEDPSLFLGVPKRPHHP